MVRSRYIIYDKKYMTIIIIATDAFLAEVYSLVKDRNAVILYISDHGEVLGEGGAYFHGIDIPAIHNPACILIYTPAYAASFSKNRIAAIKLKS